MLGAEVLLPGTRPPEWEKPALSCWVDASWFCIPLALRNPGLIYIYLGGLNYRTSTAVLWLMPEALPTLEVLFELNIISSMLCVTLFPADQG